MVWSPMPQGESGRAVDPARDGRLLAIDLGLRCGLSVFSDDGQLLAYRSTHFLNPATLRKVAWKVLAAWPNLTRIVVEGDRELAEVWGKLATKRSIQFTTVTPQQWRADVLKPSDRRNGQDAKVAARKCRGLGESPLGLGAPRVSNDVRMAILITVKPDVSAPLPRSAASSEDRAHHHEPQQGGGQRHSGEAGARTTPSKRTLATPKAAAPAPDATKARAGDKRKGGSGRETFQGAGAGHTIERTAHPARPHQSGLRPLYGVPPGCRRPRQKNDHAERAAQKTEQPDPKRTKARAAPKRRKCRMRILLRATLSLTDR